MSYFKKYFCISYTSFSIQLHAFTSGQPDPGCLGEQASTVAATTPKPEIINEPPAPEPPKDATRSGEAETIVYIDHADLHPFKDHPFQVRDDYAMKTLVVTP